MEPFQWKVHQVNFEEGDFSLTNEQLDSFDTVIHYDSHFSQSESSAPAIHTTALSYSSTDTNREREKRITRKPRAVAQPSPLKTTQIYSHSLCSQTSTTGSQCHHPLINPHHSFIDSDKGFITRKDKIKVTDSDIRTLFQVTSNTAAHKKRLRKPKMAQSSTDAAKSSTPETDADGSQAFETVAEALHLQWSVIGDKKVTPASPEVVAQIVAEAQRKLKLQSPTTTPSSGTTFNDAGSPIVSGGQSTSTAVLHQTPVASPSPVTLQSPVQSNSPVSSLTPAASVSTVVIDSQSSSTTHTSHITASSDIHLTSDIQLNTNITSPSSAISPSSQQDGQKPDSDIVVRGPSQSSPNVTTRELIRVPADSITTTKQKSTWFSAKPGVENTDKKSPIVSIKSDTKEERFADHASDQGSERDDIQSLSSAASELESFGQSETEKFLKSLPPYKTVDVNDIVPHPQVTRSHSPPVKETSFRPVQGQMPNQQIVTESLSQSGHFWNALQDTKTQMVDSGIGIDIESAKRDTVNQQMNIPKPANHIMPQPGPLFPTLQEKSTSNLSEITSTNAVPALRSSQHLHEVLREKAKLEGQLEMLTHEAHVTLQERAELQAQIASLKQKLTHQSELANDQEKMNLKSQISKMQKTREVLEQSMASAQKFLNEKISEVKILQEDVQVSQEANEKLQMKVKEMRDELKSKEMTIQALKNKIAELYVEVQTVMQSKMISDNEARSAKSDLTALINAKLWYQQQLQAANEAKSKLQQDLTTLQGQASSQVSITERLKTENTRLRHQLKDTQQKALKDKESLAKHLETIETDMMEREAAFQEIQRERSLLEGTFDTKLQSVEEERVRFQSLMQVTNDLENQLDRAQSDLKKKHSQIISLENEQTDLMKRLTLSQENMIEKERIIEELQQNLLSMEAQLKAFQSNNGMLDSEIWKLKEEQASTEIALKAALEEKSLVDQALENLQENMSKVEKSFRQMKQELSSKTDECNKVKSEKVEIQDELEKTKENIKKELKENASSQREADDREKLVEELELKKVKLETELEEMKSESRNLKESEEVQRKEKDEIQVELLSMRQKLTQSEHELQNAKAEFETLQKSSENQNSSLNEDLIGENRQLQDKVAELEKLNKKDTKQHKLEIDRLNADLYSLQNEIKERQTTFETNVELLSDKLREVTAVKDKLETELDIAHRKYDVGMLEQQDQMKTELQHLITEVETLRLEKQSLESQLFEQQKIKDQQIHEYQQKLSALEHEISGLQENQANKEEIESTNQMLSLELEKEKGRVAGLMQTNSSLKQHVSQLEDALARRESSLSEMQYHVSVIEKERGEVDEEYKRRIQSLEDSQQEEKETQRQLRKQIGTKITENKKLKRQLDSSKSDVELLQQDIEQRNKEMESLQSQLESSKQLQEGQTTHVNNLDAENKTIQHELERVKQELADNLAREPVLQEQLQSMQWQLSQKCREIEAIQEQARLSEQRQEVEIDNLKKTTQESADELESLRSELAAVRKEKSNLQGKVSELRSTLKASVQHHKLTKKINKKKKDTVDAGTQVDDVIIPPLPFDLDTVEKLVQDTGIQALESKPLDNLQNCLSSLRSEISGLQKQVDQHSNSLDLSSQSWSSVETSVNELWNIVKTVSDTANETMTTMSIAASAVETADQSLRIFDI